MTERHLLLRVQPGTGYEPVHVEKLHGETFRVLYSPGLVYGIAAGDIIRAGAGGEFQVIKRGGNLAVRLLSKDGIAELKTRLQDEVANSLGGWLDGMMPNGLVWTIPVRAGFSAVESCLARFTAAHPSAVWEYGNVYDQDGRPLDWWKSNV